MLESALCLLYISVFIIDSSRSSTMATPLNHTEGIGKSLQDQEVNTALLRREPGLIKHIYVQYYSTIAKSPCRAASNGGLSGFCAH
jgi:hypothetical protein